LIWLRYIDYSYNLTMAVGSNIHMTDVKDGTTFVEDGRFDVTTSSDTIDAQKYGNEYDHRDMMRMGKLQQLRVRNCHGIHPVQFHD
jgi:hypothetical protein